MSQPHHTDSETEERRVLAVGAHSDDIDVPGGGTIAKWIAAGAEVYLLILTNGDRGSDDPGATKAGTAAERRREQQAAAAILGIKEVYFADYGDCELENAPISEVRGKIVELIRRLKPDTMIFWDPDLKRSLKGRFANHPDHRVAGQAALDAAALFACNLKSYPEYPGTHKVSKVLMVNPDEANWTSDIIGYTDVKAKALEAHTSQAGLIAEAARFGATTELAHGLPTAEAFVLLDLRD